MPTYQDYDDELARGVKLTRLADKELNVALTLVTFVDVLANSMHLVTTRADNLTEGLSNMQKATVYLSKAPYVCKLVKLLGKASKSVKKPLKTFNDKADDVENKFQDLAELTSNIGTLLLAAKATTFAVRAQYNERRDGLDIYALFQDKKLDQMKLKGEGVFAYDQVKGRNNNAQDHFDASQPSRDALKAIDGSLIDLVTYQLEEMGTFLGQIEAGFEWMFDIVELINEALEPVKWAFDVSEKIQKITIDPVIDAVMDATGVDKALKDALKQMTPFKDDIEKLAKKLKAVEVEMDKANFGGVLNDFWGDFGVLFEAGEGFDLMENLGIQALEQKNGSFLFIGTSDDDALDGSGDPDHVGGRRRGWLYPLGRR